MKANTLLISLESLLQWISSSAWWHKDVTLNVVTIDKVIPSSTSSCLSHDIFTHIDIDAVIFFSPGFPIHIFKGGLLNLLFYLCLILSNFV